DAGAAFPSSLTTCACSLRRRLPGPVAGAVPSTDPLEHVFLPWSPLQPRHSLRRGLSFLQTPAGCPPSEESRPPSREPTEIPLPERRRGVVVPPTNMRMHGLFHDNCFDGPPSPASFSRFHRDPLPHD